MAISGGVLRQLSDGLAELYAPASAPGGLDYAARVVRVVSRLVPVDSCSYNHLGDGPRLLAWLIEPADVGTFPGGIQLFQRHLPEHPLVAHIQTTGDGRALRISDFLSDRQYRSLGLYHDFYRPCGVEYQAAISLAAPGGGLIGVALNRQRRDFSTDDLELLDLLRIHVEQAAAIAVLTQPGTAASPDSAANPLLTARQARILQLVADGQSDRGIARTLGISTRTVQAHLQHTYRALDVSSRTEAVARLRALSAMPALNLPGHHARS
jgi:DNA-binding CsgD family transcriptional regulator